MNNFTISYALRSGSTVTGCSGNVDARYTLNAQGQFDLTDPTSLTLIDHPLDAMDMVTTDVCQYTAMIPATFTGTVAGKTVTMVRTGPGSVTLDGDNRDFSVNLVKTGNTFNPSTTISVPPTATSGTSITVSYAPISGSNSGCSGFGSAADPTEVFTVGNNGNISGPATQADLIDRPDGVATRCVYEVSFEQSPGDLTFQTSPDNRTEAGNRAARGEYMVADRATEFTPDITITVPQINESTGFSDLPGTPDDDSIRNIHTGTTFTVSFADGGPISGCSTSITPVTYTVHFSGRVEGTPPTLTDSPVGVEGNCQYNVSFAQTSNTANPGDTAAHTFDSVTPAHATLARTATTFAGGTAITANYGLTTATTFTPEPVITVPNIDDSSNNNIYSGTTFAVSYGAGTGATNCSPATGPFTYTVQPGDSVTGTSDALVDFPVGTTAAQTTADTRCSYVATITTSSSELTPGTHVGITRHNRNPSFPYTNAESTFTPVINITVPDYDGQTPGTNFYSTTQFMVDFAAGTGATGCSDAVDDVVYTIGTSRTATGTAPTLIDRPAGQTGRCSYAVSFPSNVEGADDRITRLQLQDPVDNLTLSNASATTRTSNPDYLAIDDTSFRPEFEFTVPQDQTTPGTNDYTDQTITVTIADGTGATGCTTGIPNFVFTVRSGGTVERTAPSGLTPFLIDRPAGQDAQCSYVATIPTEVPSTPPAVLQTSGDTHTFTYNDQSATRAYIRATNEFTPNIVITVPPITLSDNSNFFEGATFVVNFGAGTGHANCSPALGDITYTVATVTERGQILGRAATTSMVSLVDQPAGTDVNCSYEVTFPAANGAGGNVAAGDLDTSNKMTIERTITQASPNAQADYVIGDDITFTPSNLYSATVPEPLDDSDFLILDGIAFAAATFTPVTGSVGCTEDMTATGTISDKSVRFSYPTLLGFPAGSIAATAMCRYTVALVESVSQTTGGVNISVHDEDRKLAPDTTSLSQTIDVTTTTTTTSFDYALVAETFDAVVNISVPQINVPTGLEDDDATTMVDESMRNAYSGTQFTVTFDADTRGLDDTSDGCSSAITAQYTVNDAGDVIITQSSHPNTAMGADLVLRLNHLAEVVGSNDTPMDEYPAQYEDDTLFVPCTYTATFPPTAGDLSLVVVVSEDNPEPETDTSDTDSPSADYGLTTATTFTPMVAITVPRVNGGTDPDTNEFDGTTFTVSFANGTGATGCDTSIPPVTYTVQPNGDVTGTHPTLTDRPAGVTDTSRCSYVASIATTSTDLVHNTAQDMSETDHDSAPSFTYISAQSDFAPNIQITVPQYNGGADPATNRWAGATFVVSLAGGTEHANCSQNIPGITYEVNASGDAVPTATPMRLTDRPEGAPTIRCSYQVTFPNASATVEGLTQATNPAPETEHTAAQAATASYGLTEAVNFTPAVSITVPLYDGATPGTNAFATTTFMVTFAAGTAVDGTTPLAGCSGVSPLPAIAAITYTVGTNGTVTGTNPELVDRPVGATSADTRCSYEATISAPPAGLSLESSEATATLGTPPSGGNTPTFAYTNTVTNFRPTITISVPQFNGGQNTATNRYDGAEFELNFAISTDATNVPSTGCSTAIAAVTYTGQPNGSVTGTAPLLIDRPAGQGTVSGQETWRCTYTITFPERSTPNHISARLASDPEADPEVAATDTDGSASYGTNTAESFTSNVSITVPMVDADGTPGHDYAGETFQVRFAPIADSHSGCTGAASTGSGDDATETHTIQSGGSVMRTGSARSLVDRPVGVTDATRCRYNVVLPDRVRVFTPPDSYAPDTTWVDGGRTGRTVAYELTHFEPVNNITVDPGLGTLDILRVAFSSSGAGCTTSLPDGGSLGRYVTYEHSSGGMTQPVLTGSNARSANSDVALTANDDNGVPCVYNVAYGGTSSSNRDRFTIVGTAGRAGNNYLLQTGATRQIRQAAPTMNAHFYDSRAKFEVILDVTLPDSATTGLPFPVTFTADTGTGTNCTTPAVTANYVIVLTGTLGEESEGRGVALAENMFAAVLNRGSGNDCRYDVGWPDPTNLTLDSEATNTAQVHGTNTASRTATATYEPSVVFYDTSGGAHPTVTITVPFVAFGTELRENYLAGTQITIMYNRTASSDEACSNEVPELYTVPVAESPSGKSTLTPPATRASLVLRPEGETDEDATCDYTVVFPNPAEAMLGNYTVNFTRTSQETAITSDDRAASADYGAYTSFTPTFTIRVPDSDDDADGTNDFATTVFEVDIAAGIDNEDGTEDVGCSGANENVEFTVGMNGTVTGTAPDLIDRPPSNLGIRCYYAVTYQTTVSAAATSELSGTTLTLDEVTVEPTRMGALESAYFAAEIMTTSADYHVVFEADVTIRVPDVDGGTAGENRFATETFDVMFDRADGPTSGCSDEDVTYTVQTNDSVTPAAAVSLIDRPVGEAGQCSYTVTFPDSEEGGTELTLTTDPAPNTDLGRGDTAANADYHTAFDPTVTIRFPYVDIGSDGNDYAGATVDVTFDRSAGPATGCSDVDQTYTVQGTDANAGNATPAAAVSLVDTPAGESGSCVYVVGYEAAPTLNAITFTQTAGADTETSAAAPATSADYHIGFAPTIDIEVPVIGTAADNDLENTVIHVSIAEGTGPAAGTCSGAVADIDFTVAMDSDVDGTAPALIDRPAGETARCAYEVTFQASVAAVGAAAGTNLTRDDTPANLDTALGNGDEDASAQYNVVFTPTITIQVPVIGTATDNDLATTVIDVTIEAGTGTNADNSALTGCSAATAALPYTVAMNGDVDGTAPALIDRPAGEDGRCAYVVAFENPVTAIGDAAGTQLILDTRDGADTDTSLGSGDADARGDYYTVFNLALTITVPDYAGRDFTENAFDRTTFDVTVANGTKADGSVLAGCSSMIDDVTYTVGTTGTATSTAPTLVDRPAGESDRCAYDLTLPSPVTPVRSPNGELSLPGTDTTADNVNGGTGAFTRAYQAITRFIPNVALTAPSGDDFTAETYEVTFTRSGGPTAEQCAAPTQTFIYGIQGEGSSNGPGGIVLTDRPLGLEGANSRCEYTVNFPATSTAAGGATARLYLTDQTGSRPDRSTSAAEGNANALYHTRFEPTITITVPQYDGATSGTKAFAGVLFTISIADGTGHADCFGSIDDLVYVVGTDGTVVLAQPPAVTQAQTLPSLMDRAGGQGDRCSYELTFPPTAETPGYIFGDMASGGTKFGDLELEATTPAPVTALRADQDGTATYNGRIRFEPEVTIVVPQYDDDDAGGNDFVDTAFGVSFTSSTDTDCAAGSATYTVEADGSVDDPDVALIDRPLGADTARCVYTADFPSPVTSPATATAASVDLTEQTAHADADTSTQATNTPAQAVYHAPETTLTLTIGIDDVPDVDEDGVVGNDFQGDTFAVTITEKAGNHADCTSGTPATDPIATLTYTVDSDDSGDRSVDLTAGTIPSLVNRPSGQDTQCVYVVTFPANSTSGSAVGSLFLEGAETQDVMADADGMASATRSYLHGVTAFEPTVDLGVPQFEFVSGTNDFAGEQFTVTYTRQAGGPNNRCTEPAVTETWEITSDGGETRVGAAASLVNTVADDPNDFVCVYDVDFEYTGTVLDETSHDATASGTDSDTRTVDAAYSARAGTTFTPTVAITAPQVETTPGTNDYAGLTFTVSIGAGTNPDGTALTGCSITVTSLTYTVQSNGDVDLTSGTLPTLTDRPAAAAPRCSYPITFPERVGAVARLEWLERQTGATERVTAVAPDATATYAAATVTRTTFAPSVEISVPRIDDDGDANNDFINNTITVSYAPATAPGANADPTTDINVWCTTGVSETYAVDDAGDVAVSGTAASLIDTVMGLTGNCAYTATFAMADSASELDLATDPAPETAVDNQMTTGASPVPATVATATYETASATNFGATTALTVPAFDDDNTAGPDFAAASIQVSFAVDAANVPDGIESGCLAASVTVTGFADDGDDALGATGAAQSLVDRPAGAQSNADRCAYLVSYATAAAPANLLAALSSATTAVQHDDLAVTAIFGLAAATTYNAVLTITVPDIDDITSGTNDFTGARFTVSYAPATDANTACALASGMNSETYVVGTTDTAALTPSGSNVALVNRYVGAYLPAHNCAYVVTYPTSVSVIDANSDSQTLRLDTANDDPDITPADTAGEAAYTHGGSATEAIVDITVPPFEDADGDSIFSGTDITVTFTSTAPNCDGGSETYRVNDDGDAELSGNAASLVNRPPGVTTRCIYNVVFAATAGNLTLASTPAPTATIDGTDEASRTATATYTVGTQTTIPAPTDGFVDITVPNIDDDGTAGNDFSGATFDVEYEPTDMTGVKSGCTASATETYTVDDMGDVSLTGAAASLVDYPTGAVADTDRCSYTATFPDTQTTSATSGSGLVAPQTPASTDVDFDSRGSAGYDNAAIDFEPTLMLTVPQYDGETSGTNAFAATTFTVTYSSATANCVASATETYTVATGGTVSRTGAAASLTDRPARTSAAGTRCSFNIAFASDALGGASPSLLLAAGAPTTVSRANAQRTIDFENTRTTFEPDITITVPSGFGGTTFTATYAPAGGSDPGCVGGSESFTVGADADLTAERDNAATSLTDRPERVADRCSYLVTFASPALLGAEPDLVQATAEASLGAGNPASVRYNNAANTFRPSVTITVPQYNADASSSNAFAGVTFTVVYAPVATPPQNAGCTAAADMISETYVVAAAGTVGLQTGSGASLIDRPEGVQTSCVYGLTITVAGVGGAPAGLLVASGASTSVSVSAPATIGYENAEESFEPQVAISVPQYNADDSTNNAFAGVTFTVSFANGVNAADGSALAGCDTGISPVTYTVGNDGSVTGTAPSLVDRPARMVERCSYGLTFATSAVPARLIAPTSPSDSVSAASSAQARYTNAETSFDPQIDITASAGFTATLSVSFRSSVSACTIPGPQTFAIASTGNVAKSGTNVMLVDRPANSVARCVYQVEFPESAAGGELGLVVRDADTRLGVGDPASAQYSQVTYFNPTINITVPPDDEDADGNNDWAGTRFDVVISRAVGANSNCSDGRTETYQSDAQGNVSGSPARLVDTPAGFTDGCRYTVRFPSRVNTDNGQLSRQSGALTTLRAGVAAAASYDRFVPVSVPTAAPLTRPFGSAGYLPVKVSVSVSADAGRQFATGDVFEVLVSVPGICGDDDTVMFGGVEASEGVTYGSVAQVGTTNIVGPGASQVNSRAAYTMSSYVDRGGVRTACTLRATVVAAPAGCVAADDLAMSSDELGRLFVETTWTAGLQRYVLDVAFDCSRPGASDGDGVGVGDTGVVPPSKTGGVIAVERGWVAFPFNGETGSSPADLINALNGAVTSVWVWGNDIQNWRGWVLGRGSFGLDTLTNGDIVMAWAPLARTIAFEPVDLLDAPVFIDGETSIGSMYSQLFFSGDVPSSMESLFGTEIGPVAVVFLWDQRNQQWRYNLPGRGPVDSVDIPWFDTLSPRDTVFIYNLNPRPIDVNWF